ASVSGDTTAGGISRLPPLLAEFQPSLLILELGGNDGLRGMPPPSIYENLATMVEMAQQAGAEVLLAGMRIPPNYGKRYTEAFHAVFQRIADDYSTGLIPFLLDGVGGVNSMMQDDGIHPNTAAQPVIRDNVLRYFR
ncbi:unnamed protein product, partial [Cyprideis torosa]